MAVHRAGRSAGSCIFSRTTRGYRSRSGVQANEVAMRPVVARPPRHSPMHRITIAAVSALLLVGAVWATGGSAVLAATPMTTACNGVRLRTGPSTSDTQMGASLSQGTLVTVETTVVGGAWTVTCAGVTVSGSTWHQISQVNGQNVLALFGVPFVY